MMENRMNPDDIDQLLVNLKLRRMREVLMRELDRAAKTGCSHQDFILRMLREEWIYRQERSQQYRLEKAKLPERWEIETFPFDRQPGVNAAQIRQLANLDFVATGTNIVFIGEPGTGKTGLATGILLKAVRAGRRAMFIKAQDLFDEMFASLADRSTRQMLDRLSRIDVLHVDELGYLNLQPEQANAFFKLMDQRYTLRKPTIITTNIDYDDWARQLGNPKMTEALLSRVRHRCTTIRIVGPSLRTPAG
jgi:DNA replication protein DnaC